MHGSTDFFVRVAPLRRNGTSATFQVTWLREACQGTRLRNPNGPLETQQRARHHRPTLTQEIIITARQAAAALLDQLPARRPTASASRARLFSVVVGASLKASQAAKRSD